MLGLDSCFWWKFIKLNELSLTISVEVLLIGLFMQDLQVVALKIFLSFLISALSTTRFLPAASFTCMGLERTITFNIGSIYCIVGINSLLYL